MNENPLLQLKAMGQHVWLDSEAYKKLLATMQ